MNTINEDIKKANDKILNLLKDYSITKDKLLNNNLLDNNNLMKGISDIKLNESNNFNNGNMIDMNFSNQNNDNYIINNMNDPMNAFENNNMGNNVMNLNMVNNNIMDNMNIPINTIDNNIMNMNDMNLGARPQNMNWNNSQEQRFLSIQKSNEISILFEFKSNRMQIYLYLDENIKFRDTIKRLEEKYNWYNKKNKKYSFNNKPISETDFKKTLKELNIKDGDKIIILSA